MERLNILDIRPYAVDPGRISVVQLEGPVHSFRTNQSSIRFLAWLVAPVGLFETVTVMFDGTALASAPLLSRMDIPATSIPDGFRAYGIEITPALGPFNDAGRYTVTLAVGGPGGEAALFDFDLGFSPLSAIVGAVGTLSPLLMLSGGRTGSSVLMGALGTHSEIVVHGVIPFESKTSAYLANISRLATAPPNYPQSGGAFGFEHEFYRTGFNPYSGWEFSGSDPTALDFFHKRFPLAAARFFIEQTVDFYRAVADATAKPSARFFAEKFSGGFLPWYVAEYFAGSKSIFLVRDPRDMLCSMMAFDRKRGFYDFTGQADALVGEVAERVGTACLAWIDEVRLRPGVVVVKYEDLISIPDRIARTIFEALGLKTDSLEISAFADYVRESFDKQHGHVTSSSAQSSIGRWKRDLADDQLQSITEIFRPVLDFFGYPAV